MIPRTLFRALAVLWCLPSAATGQQLVEHWTHSFVRGGDTTFAHFTIRWSGDSISIDVAGTRRELRGTRSASGIEVFLLDSAGNRLRRYTAAQFAHDSLIGRWVGFARPSQPNPDSGFWRADRERDHKPTAVRYVPPGHYTVLSAAHTPGIRIGLGDTVRVDPVQGAPSPIYVEGALPGDMLAVRILAIRPVGLNAGSGSQLMYDWFTAAYARRAVVVPRWDNTWILDTLRGTARLRKATGHVAGLTVPMRPMLGAVGVAPAGSRAESGSEEGEWGGNLDFNGLVAGVTLYLPVFHRGAYLYIQKDAHAAQGEGELAGAGIEMSAEAEFTVDIVPGSAIPSNLQWVRAEDADRLMAFGSSGDLRVAVQRANTNLAEWLQTDYHLDQGELAAVLGTSMQLTIANLFGNQLTVVASLPKTIVAQLKR